MKANAKTEESIALWKHNFEHAPTVTFLELALSKVDNPYDDEPWIPVIDAGRQQAFSALQRGSGIDLLVSAIGSNNHSQVQRLTIPLDRGLLGIRVCLIDERYAALFRTLNTLQDMQDNDVVFLQGEGWPDVEILRANGAVVETFQQYANVEAIMQQDRPYCFGRSIVEINQELYRYPNLVLEKHLAFVYPLADIVYVSPKAAKLGALLEAGLSRSVEDGSYYNLFDEIYADVFEEYQFYDRKLFFFEHPNLTDEERQLLNTYGVASFLHAN